MPAILRNNFYMATFVIFLMCRYGYSKEYIVIADPVELAYAAENAPGKPAPEVMLQKYIDAWLLAQKQARTQMENSSLYQIGKDCVNSGKVFSIVQDEKTQAITYICQ